MSPTASRADLILVGGTVLTLDPAFRIAAAVALAGARSIDDVLEPGKLADREVLSDPLTCGEARIKDIAADMTIVGGRVVYNEAPPPLGPGPSTS